MDSDTPAQNDEEFMKRILALADEGKKHSGNALHLLTEVQVGINEVETKLSSAIAEKIESDKAIRTVGQMIRNRINGSAKTPESTRVVLPFLLVGIISLSLGSAHPSEGSPVAKAKTNKTAGQLLADGNRAMQRLDWKVAVADFQSAYARGASAEESLGRAAEAMKQDKQYDACLTLCAELESASTAPSKSAPFWRGWVYLERDGDKAKALAEFDLADVAGHPMAKVMIKRCK